MTASIRPDPGIPMSGPFDFLHIKRRTAGSSNELSLDVLDAARHRLDSQQKPPKAKRASTSGKQPEHSASVPPAPLPSQHPSALATAPEVKRRKRQRLKRSLILKVLGTLVLAAALCIAVALSYRLYQQQTDFDGRITGLVAAIRNADQELAQADKLMADPFNAFEGDQRNAMVQNAATLQQDLSQVELQAVQLQGQFPGEGEQLTLVEVQAVVQARHAMVDAWQQAFVLSDQMNGEIQQSELIWTHVVEADQQVRAAAELASAASTEQAIQEAQVATDQARDALQQAADQLTALEQQVQGLDLQPQRQYLERRIQGLDEALATADALLQGDKARAIEANEAYNRLEAEAAALAAELPASPGDQVRSAYALQTDRAVAAYSEARAWVTKADADLRARL